MDRTGLREARHGSAPSAYHVRVDGPSSASADPHALKGSPRFLTTRWSVVQAAGSEDPDVSRVALAELCEAYWYPLFAYLRRSGQDAERASDVVQGFFARLLDKRDLRPDVAGGRFRAFLLTALKHHLANENARERAAKRGGGHGLVSFDAAAADSRYRAEPEDPRTPESIYESQWARTLLDRALTGLRDDYEARGRTALFERIERRLTDPGDVESRRAIGTELGMTEGAVNVAIHRLRRQFRERLRREVAQTLTDPGEVDQELRELFEGYGGPGA